MSRASAHVRDAVHPGERPPAYTHVEVDVGEPDIMLELRFCAVCVEQRALPARITAEQWEQESERFQTEGVCGRCLRVSEET